jgi:hypothetical protein
MIIIFFDIKGTVHKEFVLADQIVNSAYYCDILQQMCGLYKVFAPNLETNKNWLLHQDNFLFHQGIFLPKIIWLSSPNHLTFSCFPD